MRSRVGDVKFFGQDVYPRTEHGCGKVPVSWVSTIASDIIQMAKITCY